jgi:membrane-bound lytic murein transglycosylase D
MLKRKLVRAGFFGNGLLLTFAMFNEVNVNPVIDFRNAGTDTSIQQLSINDSLATTVDLSGSLLSTSAHPALNSHATKFVKDYIAKSREMLEEIKEGSQPYFKIIDSIFCKYDVPLELKYLAVIESKLKAKAVSKVGAAGPWQLMPATARIFNLKVSGKYDERKYYYKSTIAAARYLQDLHNQFGDWLLTIAAYNAGPGGVLKAIKRSGSRNFWKLQYFLPEETRLHVKKFIATHYFFEGHGSVATLTKDEINNYKMMDLGVSAVTK